MPLSFLFILILLLPKAFSVSLLARGTIPLPILIFEVPPTSIFSELYANVLPTPNHRILFLSSVIFKVCSVALLKIAVFRLSSCVS